MEVYRRLWPYLLRYRGRILLGIVCVFIQQLITVRIPLKVGQAFDAMPENPLAGGGVDPAAFETIQDYAWIVLWLSVFSALFLFAKRWLIISVSRHIEYDFRNDFFDKILGLSMSYFDRNRTGDIMARATNDLDQVRLVIGPGILYPINTVSVVLVIGFYMIQMSLPLTLVMVVPAVTLVVCMKYFATLLFRASKRVQDQFGVMSSVIQENLAGVRVVRAYVREQSEEEKFDTESRTYIGNNLRLARIRAAFFPSLLMILFWSMALLLFVGGRMVQAETITIGQLVSFFLYLQMLVWPLIGLGWVVSVIQRGAAAMERMTAVLDFKTDVPDVPEPLSPKGGMRGHVEFRNLSFSYPGSESPQLKDISIDLPPGQTLGIVGPTGCGKSTLVNLLLRFYPIHRGELLVDGIDINDWKAAELRRGIGIVTQETFLFSDTIANNIAFGTNNGTNFTQVVAAAQIAQLDEDVQGFPNRYETSLGEKGINLSGGQQQRTAIARALYRDPKILILDDALSAVDTETESKILEGLRTEMEERTTLLISHRVSTVMLADEIVFLDDGQIIERGSHAQLLELGGRYAELYRQQLLASEIEEI